MRTGGTVSAEFLPDLSVGNIRCRVGIKDAKRPESNARFTGLHEADSAGVIPPAGAAEPLSYPT